MCEEAMAKMEAVTEMAPAPVFEEGQCEMVFEFVVEPLSDAQAKKLMEDIIALVEAIEPPAYIGGGFHPWREDIDA